MAKNAGNMLMYIRNVIFCFMLCLFIVGPTICIIAQYFFDLPSWMTSEDATYLSGSNSISDIREVLSYEGWISEDLQNAVEEDINCFIPIKADALLVNARIQRYFICASNSLFAWSWYPSYYGSKRLHSIDNELMEDCPLAIDATTIEKYRFNAECYNAAALNHPEMNFVFAMPDKYFAINDSWGLISNSVNYEFYRTFFSNELDDRIQFVDLGISDIEEYKEYYFKTDHHWTMDGAYDAYCKIADTLGFGMNLIDKGNSHLYEVDFHGSHARVGLDNDVASDSIKDYEFDLPDFNVYINGVIADDPKNELAAMGLYEAGEAPRRRFINHYSSYYHSDFDSMIIEAQTQRGLGSVAIFGDSYTNNMERLFLEHYDKVYVFDCRTRERHLELSKILDDLESVDDVIILRS